MIWRFFLTMLAAGTLSFGGGYAMISVLQASLVQRYGWLTSDEFNSGVAVGKITPGPLMIMVAFMGYKIAGVAGAILGTIGLFLPSMVIVLLLVRLSSGLHRLRFVSAAVKAVNLAVVAMLLSVVLSMARTGIVDVATAGIGLGSFLLVGIGRKDPALAILGGALVGVVLWR